MSTMAEESTSIYLIQSVVSSPVNSEPCQFKYSYKISPFTISPVLERKASYVKIATRFIKACCNFKADSGQAPVWGFIRVVTSDCYESLTYLSIFSTLLLTKGVNVSCPENCQALQQHMQRRAHSRFTRCPGARVLCSLPRQPISPRLATFLELRDGCVAMQVPSNVFEHLNIVK